jgi:hypothetical protein
MKDTYSFSVRGYPAGTRKENALDLATASSADLFFSCFLGDVTLELDGLSFTTRFGWVATLTFAIDLAQRVAALPEQERSILEFQEAEEWISLRHEAGRVYIACSYAKGIASVAYDSILGLVRGTLDSYVEELNRAYPRLIENPALRKQLAIFEQ